MKPLFVDTNEGFFIRIFTLFCVEQSTFSLHIIPFETDNTDIDDVVTDSTEVADTEAESMDTDDVVTDSTEVAVLSNVTK